MLYILFDKLTAQDIDEIVNALEKNGYINTRMGALRINAIGVATTPNAYKGGQKSYAFLSDRMCSENPHVSWTFCRKQCFTKDEFINNLM